MGKEQKIINGIDINDLRIISNQKGDIYHALKSTDSSYSKFGEAYFSTVKNGVVKGWKRHKIMISNLIVPFGEVKVVFFDDRKESTTYKHLNIFNISKENYKRITVKPGIWFAFEGVKENNLLLNISNILHDPLESDNLDLDNQFFNYYSLTNK